MTESVKVMVRSRPMNQNEIQKECKNIIEIDKIGRRIGLKKISSFNTTVKNFTFDYVFDQSSTQQQVYEQSSFSLVQNVLNGYNATIFAYGQTGCGKTHTMLGVTTTLLSKKTFTPQNDKLNSPVTVTSLTLHDETMGIIPRAFRQIMTVTNSQPNKNHLIQCTFIQIYNQQIHDLLGKDIKTKINLQQTPDGLIMKDLSVHLAKNISDMQKYMEIGYKNRVIRQTSMNKESSRSHCIFTIRIQESEFQNGIKKFKVGKLNLVDLAGSQRQSKTNLRDEGVKEAAKINLSLSALGNVISALVDGKKQHIPYRDSKLTRILNDSLGGNTKTVMIATISPVDYNYEQTLSTLRYSSRAKFIQNQPIINQDPKDALLRKYEEQIKRLKLILQGKLPYTKGNQTFYLNSQTKQINIFDKFPQLKNSQNQAIINQIHQNHHLTSQNSQSNSNSQIQSTHNKVNSNTQNNDSQQVKRQLIFLQQVLKKQTNTSPQAIHELQKINELKQKLKQQALKEQQLKQQQKKRQLQLLTIQQNYKNLNDQVDSIKVKFHQLRIKYVETSQQLKDARQAHEKQKQQILQALRIQQAENNKLMQVLNVILQSNQLQKIFKNCQWVHQSKNWIVPKFKFSDQQGVTLLKSKPQSYKLIDNKKVNKQLGKLQKDIHQMRKTNFIVQQKKIKDKMLRSSKSEAKIIPNKNLMKETQSKIYRSKSHKEELKDMNLFQLQQRKKQFKDPNRNSINKKDSAQIQFYNTVKKQQQKVFDKSNYSLQSLPKIKIQQEKQHLKLPIDLEEIKREIMNEIRQKNKGGIGSRKY